MKILFAYDIKNNDFGYVYKLKKLFKKALIQADINSSLSEFWNPTELYDLVIINWPDYLFDWRIDLNNDDLTSLRDILNMFKMKGTKILTIVHDEYAHHNRTFYRDEIFNICYSQSDALAHLGEYSLKKYTDNNLTKNLKHFLLYHPLFEGFNFDYKRDLLKKQYKLENKFVILVAGNIRNESEYKLVKKVFKKIDQKNKFLFVQRISYFPKRNFFEKIKNKLYNFRFGKIMNYSNKKFLNNNELSKLFTLADIVLIPRYNILNSGNIFLAKQFNKRIIGFESGNITEWLKKEDDIILYNDDFKNIKIDKMNCFSKDKIQKLCSDDFIENQIKNIINNLF